MAENKIKLYVFGGSAWANAPKIALSEADFPEEDVERIDINLGEGKNFESSYLKINPHGTIPSLESDGKNFTDSTTCVKEILDKAPHPPRVHAHHSTSIIEEIHGAAHDCNATLIFATNDEDREAKANGIPKAFLEGRQKALDKLVPEAPEEFKAFLKKKQAGNKQLLEFYTGNPDEQTKEDHYNTGKELWKSVGIVIRGCLTQAIHQSGGPFAAGQNPGESDFHIITWLARTISNAGVEPGSPSDVALPKLQKLTGGHAFDPVIGKYWDAWIKRDSFTKNNIH